MKEKEVSNSRSGYPISFDPKRKGCYCCHLSWKDRGKLLIRTMP